MKVITFPFLTHAPLPPALPLVARKKYRRERLCGLTFPITRTARHLRHRTNLCVSHAAPKYFAAVFECSAAEVLEARERPEFFACVCVCRVSEPNARA